MIGEWHGSGIQRNEIVGPTYIHRHATRRAEWSSAFTGRSGVEWSMERKCRCRRPRSILVRRKYESLALAIRPQSIPSTRRFEIGETRDLVPRYQSFFHKKDIKD